MNLLVADLLRSRITAAGSGPLITYYDVAAGERIELSAITVGNWVAKTANLLTWDLAVAPGDAIRLPLARTHPGHWMTAVWQLAVWQVGAYVDLTSTPTAADVLVSGPDWQPYVGEAADVLACSLHPFATGLGTGLPASVTDVDLAVRAQPDSYSPSPVSGSAPAWVDDERRLTQGELAELDGSDQRRLLVPGDPWATARDGIVAALIGGGSLVVVRGGDPDRLSRIALSERAEPAS